MNKTYYANDITAENLHILLEFWPKFMAEADEAQQMFVEIRGHLLNGETEPFSWCHLYELPVKQHITQATLETLQGYAALLQPEQILNYYKKIVDTPGQIGALPSVMDQIDSHINSTELSEKDTEVLLPSVAGLYGISTSMFHTLRCVLYYGCFLNELIERIRTGDDKALFDAVRIDPTVIGCISVSHRISKAALLKDDSFFDNLKNAINGKMAKREQANFQKMRLVLEVLHEAGATRLSNAQLQELFVKELDLYTSNAKGGGITKALRKFADTYMKKSTTT